MASNKTTEGDRVPPKNTRTVEVELNFRGKRLAMPIHDPQTTIQDGFGEYTVGIPLGVGIDQPQTTDRAAPNSWSPEYRGDADCWYPTGMPGWSPAGFALRPPSLPRRLLGVQILMSDTNQMTNDEAPSGIDDVEVSERMIRWGVKDLTHALDRGDITLGQTVASIYRTMERVRRQDAENKN